MRRKSSMFFILLLVVAMLQGTVYAQVSVHLEGYFNEFYFTFNKPRGSIPFYNQTREIIFSNSGNESVTVSNIAASISDIPGFTVSLDKNVLTIRAEDDATLKAVFRASPDMAEGTYKGKITVTGTGVNFEEPIQVQITWPDPALNATWDVVDWGSIKAGSNLTRKLIINETMGYKPVSNVELTLVEFGPANLSYAKNLGAIASRGSNIVSVEINTPTRGLTPARYLVSPSILANNTASINVSDAFYEIPPPVLQLDKDFLSFGNITFEPGKDTATQRITISEIRGYTPIEGLNISMMSGESGWIDFPEIDYISPGSSVPITFSLRLPPEASLGVKEWRYLMSTRYAGRNTIIADARVYFPGVEDAIRDLDFVYSALNATGLLNETGLEKLLLDNTRLLLENARGETELRDITMVMSVYSGARSLAILMDEFKGVKDKDLERAGALVVLANNALKRIRIGNENLDKQQLKKYSEICSKSGDAIWHTNAESIVEIISAQAEGNKESNYRVATLYYKRGAEIYALLNDAKAVEYDAQRKRMEELYRESLISAVNLRLEGDGDLEKAQSKMTKLLDFYFVMNPFSYDEVSKTYSTALGKYGKAMELFDVAGEKDDAELLSMEIGRIRQEERIFKNAFMLYGLFWAALFVWFTARVSLGLQYFRQDEDDTHLGEVVLSKERA